MGHSHPDVLGYWTLSVHLPLCLLSQGNKYTHVYYPSRSHNSPKLGCVGSNMTKGTERQALKSSLLPKKQVKFTFIAQGRKKATSSKDNFVFLPGKPGRTMLGSPSSLHAVHVYHGA